MKCENCGNEIKDNATFCGACGSKVKAKSSITDDEFNKSKDIIKKVHEYFKGKIVGQTKLEISLLVSLMSNGHILLESVPGLAKTTAAKTLTEAVSAEFSRIQCTPDLLPSDIIGTQIFNYQSNSFETKLGPVYSNFVLLDEINRSSAKTQSAMLEAMQERQTTIGGQIYKMPELFIVIATQNPIEQEGTYSLAEAQLDRFLLKEKLEYPTKEEEIEIANRIEKDVFSESKAVVSQEDIKFLQEMSKKVYVDDAIKAYIVEIIEATRKPENYIDKNLAEYISLGSSTRGTIAFLQASKAFALIQGRTYVIPEDIKYLSKSVLRHRIALNFAALADEIKVEDIIDNIIKAIKTP